MTPMAARRNKASAARQNDARIDQEPWARLFETAIRHCQRGEWELGVLGLTQIYNGVQHAALPSQFYSYLGYGAARCNGQVDQGIKLCKKALKLEFYQPENYVNLARTYLLAKNRRAAWDAIARGLTIDPTHPELLELQHQLGARRTPIIPFLSRANYLNRILGHIRHSFRTPSLQNPRLGQ